MKRAGLVLAALLGSTVLAGAQTRQPAQITTLPATTPQEFDLLDKSGHWVPFGTSNAGVFSVSDPLIVTGTTPYVIPNANPGNWISGNTNIAFCPNMGFGCPDPPGTSSFDAQHVINVVTQGAANVQESGLLIVMNSSTGEEQSWKTSTAYASGVITDADKGLYKGDGFFLHVCSHRRWPVGNREWYRR